MAQITMKEMLDAGVHFGHQVQRWNPQMKPFVFGERGGIHIIDLQKTVVATKIAQDFVRKAASEGKRMIFVGTKKQAVEPIQEAAKNCGQFFVTKRWLGGTLTNFATIKASIDRMRKLEIMKDKGDFEYFSKKEVAKVEKEFDRLTEYLEGIREMKDIPGIMFVVDLKKEHIAVAEAKRLGIPVVGIADTNSDPNVVEYPIPGNDDAIRSIKLFANLVAEAFIEGEKEWKIKRAAEADKRAKEEEQKPKTKADEAQTDGGPSVVKMTKRKLVAAGTADDVEIEIELDEKGDEPTDGPETETVVDTEEQEKEEKN